MSRQLCIFLLLLASARPAWASHEDVGIGARAAAMGEAGVAVSDDLSAMGYNPAGLGGLPNPQFATGFKRAFQIPAGGVDLANMNVGAATPVDWPGLRGSLGLLWSYSGLANVSTDRAASLTYATRGWKETGDGLLDWGFSFKSLSRSGNGLSGHIAKAGVDLGVLYRVGDVRAFGLSILNLNGPRTDIGNVPDRAPVVFKAGYSQGYRGFTFALDGTKREPSAGRRSTQSLASGIEYWLQTARQGAFAARTGLNLGGQSKTWGLGFGWRALGAEIDYALTAPLASGSRWGNGVTLLFRFGSWNPEREYEKMLGSELRYRQELTRVLDAAEVKQWKLAEELRGLREDLERTKADLASKTLEEEGARQRVGVLAEKARRAQATLEQLDREKRAIREKSKETLFREDWTSYEKLKLQGAPDLVLLERVKQLLRDYKDSGVDLSEANQELLRLLRNRQSP